MMSMEGEVVKEVGRMLEPESGLLTGEQGWGMIAECIPQISEKVLC